ncbi:restriction endonuclease [Streptomyces sp. NPDC059568]|uniref:restriction endonuclease n=1 Tax=Streptomyces sp. NPDC059568 TaxID=3346868 RepID=UPI0036D128A9
MASRRPRLRKPRGSGEHVAAGVVAVAAVSLIFRLVAAAVDVAVHAWPVLLVLALCGLGWAARRIRSSLRSVRERAIRLSVLRITLAEIDAMNDKEFEYALRDLLIRDCWSARRVGRQGDQAADVIGRGRQLGRIVIQAKHTRVSGKVGSHVMYEVKGTAEPVHGADFAVVVTNGTFTRDAKAWGERHGVHWVDRERLRAWAEDGVALQDLLRLRGRPARRLTLGRGVARTTSVIG